MADTDPATPANYGDREIIPEEDPCNDFGEFVRRGEAPSAGRSRAVHKLPARLSAAGAIPKSLLRKPGTTSWRCAGCWPVVEHLVRVVPIAVIAVMHPDDQSEHRRIFDRGRAVFTLPELDDALTDYAYQDYYTFRKPSPNIRPAGPTGLAG